MNDQLKIGGRDFASRLMLGTGKFATPELMANALEASGCEIVTIAMRRVDLSDPKDDFLKYLNVDKFTFMPNTSGARDAAEAIRIAKACRAATGSDWIKVEIHPEPRYLLPDPIETLEACTQLVKDGFTVLPYINGDPVLARRLEDVGCAAVMPLAAPIGSNKGLTVKEMIAIIIEQSSIPVVVDAGLGSPAHAAECLEMGADCVLVNTAIAVANDPVLMARAFKQGVEAGRSAYLAGIAAPTKGEAIASSPLTSFLENGNARV
ncbi:MAG: thiazole synthase [Deltaproteobacteria bacterium]|nr:thiazole synthase [Deltaproteobacteria bacterium]